MKKNRIREFHMAHWDEPLIFDLEVPGERGILPPLAEEELASLPGADILGGAKRQEAPKLPELNQLKVLRHYLRLSQMTLGGVDFSYGISQGTCTMKYSPKVQEHMCAHNAGITEVHPLQPAESMQGILEIYYKTEQMLKAISGLDAFSFQPAGGAQAIYAAASIMRAYHASRGDTERNEILTTMFSHPGDASAPATCGYKVITLMPEADGLPSLEAYKAALGPHTAGIFITNPEDTGIYNPRITELIDAAHAAGALCFNDQANANGTMGIARAGDAGFDMCHFNLHKTFSSPHGCAGPAAGAVGVRKFLEPFLPVPRVVFDGETYGVVTHSDTSIGQLRSFFGNVQVVLRAYMWIMQLGPDGIREAAITSVLNNNYMFHKIRQIRGVEIFYDQPVRRLEQVRYSWNKLYEDTGLTTSDIAHRLVDYGIPEYMQSHHPYVVPEPFTLEPCESYNKDDIDEYCAVLEKVSEEAYANPGLFAGAPYNAAARASLTEDYDVLNIENLMTTMRAYRNRNPK